MRKLRIACFVPPPRLRIGGLDTAIYSINKALESMGHSVDLNSSDLGSVDIAHFHGLWQPQHAKLSRQFFNKQTPVVISPHGMLEPWAWRHKYWKKLPYYYLWEKRHLRRASVLLATSGEEAKRLELFADHPKVYSLPLGITENVLPNSVFARDKLGWERDEFILLYLSRLHVKKGADLLLRSLTKLSLPEKFRLVVVGDGEEQYVSSLHAFAHSHLKQIRIDWVGAVWGEERWKYFQGADLFCLPTHSENFGIAVLESLQVGTPVITTTGTPWASILKPPYGNIIQTRVEELAESIQTCLKRARPTAATRQELSEWTRERFDWAQLRERYSKLFSSLVN